MAVTRHKYITDFFNVSVLVPVNFDEVDAFRRNMRVNQNYLMQNGIEVILVLSGDAPDAMRLPDEFPFINWKIVFAEKVGIVASLNVGLGYARQKYIFVMDAEAVFETDLLYLVTHLLYHYPQCFAVIPQCGMDAGEVVDQVFGLEYRTLMAERASIESIGGYRDLGDQRLSNVNIQRRLELMGLRRMALEAVCFGCSGGPVSPLLGDASVLFPKETHAVSTRSESTIGYEWTRQKNRNAIDLVLGKFGKVALQHEQVFQQEYGIIGLIQTRNEALHVASVLSHLDALCDGIILLDDGSTDGSYVNAASAKLLIKAQKSYDGLFDDLTNRNLLLELAYLFKSAWFFFIDADERFDLRYANLRHFAQMKDIDTISFKLVHLWDMDRQYRTDFPEGTKGIISRNRMFRNRGFLQVTAEREIHFCATPFKQNRIRASILLLHYGLLNETDRIKKFQAYQKQDAGGKKQGYPYEFLLDKTVELGNIDDIVLHERRPRSESDK